MNVTGGIGMTRTHSMRRDVTAGQGTEWGQTHVPLLLYGTKVDEQCRTSRCVLMTTECSYSIDKAKYTEQLSAGGWCYREVARNDNKCSKRPEKGCEKN